MTTALFQEPAPAAPAPDEAAAAAVPDPDAPTPDAPYGWTTDPATGVRRPKKTAGRRKVTAAPPAAPAGPTPSLEELKAAHQADPPAEDVAPAHTAAPRVTFLKKDRPHAAPKPPPAPAPPFRAGPIAKGVNKIYRRVGKIIKIWDPMVGAAIISCTVKDEDDDPDDITTVGEAWEELARVNPRIRAFLTKAIATGAWATLFTVHAPIFLAIAMKESVQRHIPFMRLVGAFLEPDPDDEGQGDGPDLSQAMGNIGPQDLAQMMAMAQSLMGQVGMDVPRPANGRPGTQEVYVGDEVA